MSEETFAEFLASLDARAAEDDEDEQALLAPPKVAQAGRAVAASLQSGLRRQVEKGLRPTQPDATQLQRPKFCRHCGGALKPEGRFCTTCGKPITD